MNLPKSLKSFLTASSIKYTFCVLLPFLLLPLALSSHSELKCTYVVIWVAVYWLLEPIPISATALLPVVLFPLVGILDSVTVSNNYMTETFMMFIGGLIIAIAVENCNLHERIALRVLLCIGTEPIWLMLGFMLTTMFLSMWVSNTATTAMMVPIVEAVAAELTAPLASPQEDHGVQMTEINENSTTECGDKTDKQITVEIPRKPKKKATLKTALLLSVCYSANIGGTGTLTGTGPNLVLKTLMEDLHPLSEDITFATWMMYNIPGMLLCVLIAWIYLYLIFVRRSKIAEGLKSKEGIKEIISRRYRKLGSLKFQEAAVLILFVLLVALWVFRKPKFIPGWADLISSKVKIGDSVPAVAVALGLFLLPADPKKLTCGPRILDWKVVQSKLPWGVIILIGGGFALANGAQVSGLSHVLGEKLSGLSVLPASAIAAVICLLTATTTEVMSNTTTATILLPVISQMAITIGVNPLFLMLPVAVTCSYAFMLPVATAPNAIAFESGNMSALEMMKPGFVMNIICCCIQLLMINTLGVAMFNLNEFPEWATPISNETMSLTFVNNTNQSIT